MEQGISIDDFERELAELVRESDAGEQNPGSLNCEDCAYCQVCMFCEGCEHCYRCNYCEGCASCSQCTKCQGCDGCHSCSYCVDCERCMGSAFLVRCLDCTDCTYCFGCVGLSKKDFYILNRPYDRSTYFALVEGLKASLGLP